MFKIREKLLKIGGSLTPLLMFTGMQAASAIVINVEANSNFLLHTNKPVNWQSESKNALTDTKSDEKFTSADVWKIMANEWTDQAWEATTQWTEEIWQDTTTWSKETWLTPFLILENQSFFLSRKTETIKVPVALSQTSTDRITVDYQTVDGTATAGQDYISTRGTVIFNSGETENTIPIEIVTDALSETEKTLFIKLSSPNNARFVGDHQIKVTFGHKDD